MEKLYTSKKFLKMAGGRMHNPHPTPLEPPLAISYRNHQKSLEYFSHLALLVVLFYKKAEAKGGGILRWRNQIMQRRRKTVRYCDVINIKIKSLLYSLEYIEA